MAETVKRRYDATRRRQRAQVTRADILGAAGVRFRSLGYAGTSMAAIAADAGVAVETIYRAYGTKASLFRAVIEAAVAGGASRAETPVEERPAIRRIREEPDPRRQVALYAATQPGIHRRAGELLRALAAAAFADPGLGDLWRDVETARYDGQSRFVDRLAAQGSLRPGLAVNVARDVLWTLCSLAVRDALVVARGWSDEQYQVWLTEALTRELLGSE